jgi:sugar lactone lactonase YvrE
VALAGDSVFVADAGNRVVLRYGSNGAVVGRFGGKDSEYSEGFVIPSPYFPLVAAADDTLWVVDPGRHRFINFTQDGRIRSRWERSSMTIHGFCGCCNPTHFALRDDGSFVTAEKGLVRVKIHGPDGNLVGVVAAPDSFGHDTRGLALAVDGDGRILVLDPERSRVRVFAVGNGAGQAKGDAR